MRILLCLSNVRSKHSVKLKDQIELVCAWCHFDGWTGRLICELKLANCEATNWRIKRKEIAHISFAIYRRKSFTFENFSMVFKVFRHRWPHETNRLLCPANNSTMNEIERKYFHLIDSIWIGLNSRSRYPKNYTINVQSNRNFNINIPFYPLIFQPYLIPPLHSIICYDCYRTLSHSTIFCPRINRFQNHVNKFSNWIFRFWQSQWIKCCQPLILFCVHESQSFSSVSFFSFLKIYHK